MIRRLRLSLLPLLVLLASACVTTTPPARLKILQLNDVYKVEGLARGTQGGMARVRTLREQLEADGSAVLVLHAGDALYPSVMSKFLEARGVIDVMNLLDGDAEKFDPGMIVGFGNHEFDNKDERVLLSRLRESQFQWLATNTFRCHPKPPQCGERFPGVEDLLVRDIGPARVGIFALLYPMERTYMKSFDVTAAAQRAVGVLRNRGADVVIAITHQDMPDDRELVRAVPGIDIVIGGHDHVYMQDNVDGTPITKGDADARSVVVYDVTVPRRGRAQATHRRVFLDESIARDETVQARVDEWLVRLAEKMGGVETLGTTTQLLEGVEPAVRGRETALGNILADAAREKMGTDIAVVNGGSIRINDDIPPGPITTADMEGIFYYTNTLVSFPVTGRQLLDMLRNSVSQADSADGRFLQLSGVRFTYRAVAPEQFVVHAEEVFVGDRPLDLSATYTVTASDFMYLRGTEDKYDLFADANRPPKLAQGPDFRKTVEEYIRARGTVTTAVEGQIRRAE